MHNLLPALLLMASCATLTGQISLCDRVAALTREPAVAAAHWGVSVTTLDGTPLCALNATQFFRPASNAKLFTAAPALALLGQQSTVVTTIERDGVITGDTLAGNLRLVGVGDGFLSDRPMPYAAPNTSEAAIKRVNPLETLADSIVAKGLKHITGDIVGDDSLWPYEPYPQDWSIDDMVWGYGAPTSALMIEDNKLSVMVTPGASAGAPATVAFSSSIPWFTADTQVTTVAAKASAHLSIDRAAGSRVVTIRGTIALGAPLSEDLAIDSPAEYGAARLKALLEARGITVNGIARARHSSVVEPDSFRNAVSQPVTLPIASTPPGSTRACQQDCTTLAVAISPTLSEDVTVTLKVSQNQHAELLLHRLGAAYGADGSTQQGVRVLRQFWANAGIAPGEFVLFDGSGLSGHDLVTPHALTQVLTFAATQPWFATFKAALPVGGIDGSLAGRFSGPLKGKVFAKTGTLGESRALSGYLTAANGQTLAFAILVDNHTPLNTSDRSVMDRIVEAIAGPQ
jgi:D-alanyl-D-alanine carboxypeptidase/D-alanyl-D-alanine-endopeptidase (penicillin-binding protein 4)